GSMQANGASLMRLANRYRIAGSCVSGQADILYLHTQRSLPNLQARATGLRALEGHLRERSPGVDRFRGRLQCGPDVPRLEQRHGAVVTLLARGATTGFGLQAAESLENSSADPPRLAVPKLC